MGFRTAISERQRRLGDELRRLRTSAGMSLPELGELVGMKGPAVSHTESGRLGINPERLALWLDACHANDPEYRAGLLAMGQSNGKGWWTDYRPYVPTSALDLAEFEHGATRLDTYETLLIPGLLQTKGYSEVILEYAQKTVEFRQSRQRILSVENGTPFHAVIHEAALRTMYGGPTVMRDQLNHLAEVGKLPHVTIQILPFDCTVFASADTPFMLLHGRHSKLDTVLMEQPQGSPFLGEPEAVASFRRQFERLKGLALPPLTASASELSPSYRDSWGLLQHIRYAVQGR
ncbi:MULTISPECIES: helix-turn-helix transcriptional regulator [unclassified Kitasatospora]|uniref:helix-turn-helix domain-containing protein n=1 Tax=unclassified Kitasatospora TaxID=2633591 RepID=UPI003420898C|nr:helix-turn-helix domain-containing protein [Kitasatospora sp. NBC_01300]